MTKQGAGTAPCRMRSVLVIEDHPLYGEALASALRRLFKESRIQTVTRLTEGLKAVSAGFTPDLVLMDLKLPDVTGVSGLVQLKARLPDTPVLVTSALTSAEVVHAVMEAGAMGFVPKDLPVASLKRAICEVRTGKRYVPAEFRNLAVQDGARLAEVQEISKRIADLTPQQMRIMKLICAGKPNKQIAYELSLAEATVKAHITALLRRLGVQNRTQAAVMMESANLDAVPSPSAFLQG